MKLKVKLPLLFLLMFALIMAAAGWYLNFLIADKRIEWMKVISGSEHIAILTFLVLAAGLVFAVSALYFHFNITKPIQMLNVRLSRINTGQKVRSHYSARKDEIGELYLHVDELEERLYQAHKEQIDMIAAIAHDLKTPLTTINGFVELLAMQKGLSENEKQEYYELILKKSRHIAELINGFSSFTKDELELELAETKPVEVRKLFENIAAEYETELSGLDYELEWTHSFPPNLRVRINESMIRRVFGNLFSNSVRYGERKDLKVFLHGYPNGDQACFQVEDNGVGVPEEELSFLFLKFFTVDKSRQSRSGGTGLGLASCKSIVERHGGQITAYRSEFGGLGIQFTVPLDL